MLPKPNRLPGYRIPQVKAQGKAWFGSLFTLLVLTTSESVFRLGLVVSKKIDKRAVQRNRLKRQLRQIIKNQLDWLPQANDCLLLVKKKIIEVDSLTIEPELIDLFKRAFKS